MAWKTTCGSSAHACTQRSPPERLGSSSSPAKRRERRRARRAAATVEAEARRRRASGPKPNVTVSRAGREPERLAGVVGGGARLLSILADGLAGGHPRGGLRPPRRRSRRSERRVGRDVEGREWSRSWAAVTIPAWCSPWKGDPRRAAATSRRARARARPPPSAAGPRPPRRRLRLRPRRGAVGEPTGLCRLTTIDLLDPRERLGQGVDRLAELGCRGLVSVGVRRRTASRGGTARAPRRRANARSISAASARLLRAHDRAAPPRRRSATLDVGLEVDEVGVRVALLLAGDLRLRDLVSSSTDAVRDLRRLELDVLHDLGAAGPERRRLVSLVGEWPSPRSCLEPRASARSGGSPSTARPGRRLRARRSAGRGHRRSRRPARSRS